VVIAGAQRLGETLDEAERLQAGVGDEKDVRPAAGKRHDVIGESSGPPNPESDGYAAAIIRIAHAAASRRSWKTASIR
jgi:hypothetical protein